MAASKTNYVCTLSKAQAEQLHGLMEERGWEFDSAPYAYWRGKKDKTNVVAYESGKLTVQGAGTADFVQFLLEPEVLKEARFGYETELAEVEDPAMFLPHAGIDESGKGDFFGPLVVACCYTDETLSNEMREMGARDCKQMSDAQVLAVGSKLRRLLGPERYAVVKIGPAAYNRLYAKIKNINRLLAWAHGTCIEELLEKQPSCPKVVVDQFAPTEAVIKRSLKERGKKIVVDQHHRAESDSIAVAAASVIARELFLRAIADMATEDGPIPVDKVPLDMIPRGSSDPRVRQLAVEMVKKHGATWLMNHCKAHFQTTDKVLAECGLTRADLPPEGQVTSAVTNGRFHHRQNL